MLTCPMCKKAVAEDSRVCPRCRADLSLLVDYVDHLEEGLARAQALTREGDLGEAVWAYLEVLEVDPDNAVARRQVGRVATAVRQFDRVAVGRRWLARLQRQSRFRHWLARQQESSWLDWPVLVVALLLVLAALGVGYGLGRLAEQREQAPETSARSLGAGEQSGARFHRAPLRHVGNVPHMANGPQFFPVDTFHWGLIITTQLLVSPGKAGHPSWKVACS